MPLFMGALEFLTAAAARERDVTFSSAKRICVAIWGQPNKVRFFYPNMGSDKNYDEVQQIPLVFQCSYVADIHVRSPL